MDVASLITRVNGAKEGLQRARNASSNARGNFGRFETTLAYMHHEMITNLEEAEDMRELNSQGKIGQAHARALWFERVRPGEEWDHKGPLQEILAFEEGKENFDFPIPGDRNHEYYYDIWSNIHYGYVGSAAGFEAQTLQDGANVPIIAGRNDAGDVLSIQIGMELWEKHGSNLTPEHIHEAILAHTDEYLEIQEADPEINIVRENGNGR